MAGAAQERNTAMTRLLWAVCAAVTAAVLFGIASVLEQRNARQVRCRGALSPRLMVDLLKRPAFVGALGVNALGSVLQIVALHLGSLAEMPVMMTAADVVVTNGGGTALEAIAAARPVMITDPVPGHGRANADVMAAAGLARLALAPGDLTAVVRRLAADPSAVARQAAACLERARSRRRKTTWQTSLTLEGSGPPRWPDAPRRLPGGSARRRR